MSVNKLLIRDNKLTINNGKIIFVEDGVEAECNCCGPGCPERKICTDSQGDLQYPVPVNDFYIEVSGIPNTMSATANYFYDNSASGVGCFPCETYTKINTDFSYQLNGFAALNGIYNISEIFYHPSSNTCNDVCLPCTYSIKSRRVPLTGTFNRTQTTSSKVCIPPEPNNSKSIIDQVLCSSATITMSLVNDEFVFGISISSAINSFGAISPTRPYEYSYISLRSCNPPSPPTIGVSYLGDFVYFGFPTGNSSCVEEEVVGNTLLNSSSFQCPESALNLSKQFNVWEDCFYFAEGFFGEDYLNCDVYGYTSTSYQRSGLNSFNVKVVRL